MSEINYQGSLSFDVDGVTGEVAGQTPSGQGFDFTAPAKYHNERQTLSTTIADIDLGDVGWTDVTFLAFKNASSTTGDIIYVIAPPNMVAGFTDDGDVAGASVPNTLTAAFYYKRITTAGTSQGITWAPGDLAVYKGSSGSYAQIRGRGFKLLPGWTAGPFCVSADGGAWRAYSAQNTPQLSKVAVGACS